MTRTPGKRERKKARECDCQFGYTFRICKKHRPKSEREWDKLRARIVREVVTK